MEEVLLGLIAKLEAVAPHIWALAVRQVWVNVVRDSIVGLLSLALVYVMFRWVRPAPDDGDKDIRWAAFVLCAACFGLVATMTLYSTIGAILNPQWAAIDLVRSLVP